MMIFKFLKFPVLLIAMGMIILACREQPEAPWVSLFDSKTLNGWTQKGGEALYEVREGDCGCHGQPQPKFFSNH